jgi:hypothetical protein
MLSSRVSGSLRKMVLCGECIELGAADGWCVLQGDEVVALIT